MSQARRAVVVVLAAALVAPVVSLAAISAASTPGLPSGPTAPDRSLSQRPTAEAHALGREIVEDRTATSRTYMSDSGRRVTRLFPQPVNFRDGHNWRAIDNTLVDAARAGFLHGKANNGDGLIPRDLTKPVTVSRAGAWVRFGLRDARGSATVAGAQASFDDVADGVDAAYRATNSGVKETLTLAATDAESTFVYDLAASEGLHARTAPNGSIVFADTDRHDRFVITPPVVWDAARPAAVSHTTKTELVNTDAGWRLTVAVDRLWLRDPARVFPVTVDPNVQWIVGGTMRYSGAQRDCTLASGGSADTSFCADPVLTVGSDASKTYKSLLYFDARSAIPQDSTIFDATLLLHAGGTGTAQTSNLRVRRVTSDWTDAATWNTRDGSTAWTLPGGDVGTRVTDVGAPAAVDALDSWYYLRVPAELVQGWIWGDDPDYGLQVSADADSPSETYSFESTDGDPWKWPAIDLYWYEDEGDRASYTQNTQRLSDHSQLAINVANGNLTYTERDLTLPGAGPDLAVTRRWNSIDGYRPGAFARGWTDMFEGTWVRRDADDSLLLSDTTAAQYRLAPGSAPGTFVSPSDLDVTMCRIGVASGCGDDDVSGGAYKLTYHETGLRYYYSWSGVLGAIKDADGNTICLDWQDDALRISGPGSRELTYHRDLDGYTPLISDGTHNVIYNRDITDDDRLASVTDAGANTTHYDYSDDGSLTKITDPTGGETHIDWEWVDGFDALRPSKITRVLDSSDPTNPAKNPTTTYNYDTANRSTVVTDPAGNATTDVADDGQTTYTYDKYLHVTSASPRSSALPVAPTWPGSDVDWDTTRPTSQPSGPWHDLAGNYVDGQGTTNITLAATDPAGASGAVSGIRRVALEEGNDADEPVASELICADPSNPPRACPATVSQALALDETPLSEGNHSFRQVTQDLAGNTGVSAGWTVAVDRTAPTAPSGFAQGLFYPGDPDPSVVVSWDSTDPGLPDGADGSGVAASVVRYRINGGTYTAWQSTDGSSVDVPGVSVGTTIDVEAQSVDAVGNTSTVATATVTVVARDEDPSVEAAKAATYQAEYGGTMSAATAWIDVQDRANGLGDVVAASSSGPGYAGMWFDNAAQQVVVNLKTGTSDAGSQSALSDAGLTADSRIAYVSYTQQELDDAFDVLEDDLDDILATQVIQMRRNDRDNVIAVDVGTDTTSDQRSRISAGAAGSAVVVTVRDSSEPNFHTEDLSCVTRKDPTGLTKDRNGSVAKVPMCDPPLRGGIFASPQRSGEGGGIGACTTAFTATVPGQNEYYLMTAGHCTSGFSGPLPNWYAYWSDGTKHLLGATAAQIYGKRGDAGLIGPISNIEWGVGIGTEPRPWVYLRASGTGSQQRTTQYRIRRVDYTHEGDIVCVSGSTSAGHCGKVTAVRQGAQNFGTIDLCGVLPGDSGGPVVSAGSARGIIVRRTTNILNEDKCRVDFQSAHIAETLLDVQIMTHYPPNSP